jgi:hypothetical protein
MGSIGASAFSAVTLNGTATVTYDITVIGTTGNSVPVYLTGSIGGSATTFQNTTPPIYSEMASSSISIADNLSDLQSGIDVYSVAGSTSDSSPAPYQTTITLQPITVTGGSPYVVQLLASINLNGTISPPSTTTVSGSAAADPVFTLDSTEIADGYSIEYSPGITVPEPSNWALFLEGAGMLALLVKCKRIKG